MGPNTTSSTSSAMEAFNKTLNRSRNERGRRANPGSGFENAGASRGQVFRVIRRTKVRTVGRSIFSTLALGLKLNKNDPDLGMRLEMVEDVEYQEAMDEIVEQARRAGDRKRAAAAAMMTNGDGDAGEFGNGDSEVASEPSQKKPIRRGARKGTKKTNRLQRGRGKDKVVVKADEGADLDAIMEAAEGGSGGPDKHAVSPLDEDESDEDEAYRIRIPSRRTPRKTAGSFTS